jgi:hypothetical protein
MLVTDQDQQVDKDTPQQNEKSSTNLVAGSSSWLAMG